MTSAGQIRIVTETNCNISCRKRHGKSAEAKGAGWAYNEVRSVGRARVSVGQAGEKIHRGQWSKRKLWMPGWGVWTLS